MCVYSLSYRNLVTKFLDSTEELLNRAFLILSLDWVSSEHKNCINMLSVTLNRCIICPWNQCLFEGILLWYTVGCTGCIFCCFLEVSRCVQAYLLSKCASGGMRSSYSKLVNFLTHDRTLVLKYYQFLYIFILLVTVTWFLLLNMHDNCRLCSVSFGRECGLFGLECVALQ